MKKFKSALLIAPLTLSLISFENVDAAPIQNDSQISQVDFSKTVSVLGSSPFKDVKADHYAYEAILWAYEKGIINGYQNGNFGHSDNVTEAQFVKMIANYLQLKQGISMVDKKTDSNHWSDEFYNALAKYEVPLNGYLDNDIRNQPVKRGIVAQSLGHLLNNQKDLKGAVQFLLDNEITTGQNIQFKDSDITKFFGASNNLNRSQVVVFLHRMEKLEFNKVNSFVNVIGEGNQNSDVNVNLPRVLENVDNSLQVKSKPKVANQLIITDSSSNYVESVSNGSSYNETKEWKKSALPYHKEAKYIDYKVQDMFFKKLGTDLVKELNDKGYVIKNSSNDKSLNQYFLSLIDKNGKRIVLQFSDTLNRIDFPLSKSREGTKAGTIPLNEVEFGTKIVNKLWGTSFTTKQISKASTDGMELSGKKFLLLSGHADVVTLKHFKKYKY